MVRDDTSLWKGIKAMEHDSQASRLCKTSRGTHTQCTWYAVQGM